MKSEMKREYQKPTMEEVLIEGGHHLLDATNNGSGINATISGYGEDNDADYGFDQSK